MVPQQRAESGRRRGAEDLSEWQAAAEKLSTDGKSGIGLPANKQLYTDQTVYSFMVNSGAGDLYNDDGSIAFDKPETVKAYDFYSKLAKFSPPDNSTWTWGGGGMLCKQQLRHDPAVRCHQHLRNAGRR